MNKLFILLFFLVSLTTAKAQISRTIWGVTLGESTPQQVKLVLSQKGYRINIMPDGSYAISVDNVSFGGAMWTYINFSFVNGRLSQVWFQNNNVQSPIDINKVYDKLRDLLSNKYAHYYFDLPTNETITKWCNFSDEKTCISRSMIPPTYDDLGSYITLSYKDEYLLQKKLSNEYDEL